MVLTSPPPPALSPALLEPFYTTDDLLSNAPVLVFYGASSSTPGNSLSSRLQVHVYTPAGLQSYPRLTISPNSPLYAAVTCLAREDQGDEICRALAFSLYKYFSELSPIAKRTWESQSNTLGKLPSAPPLFGQAHAAILASRMAKVENAAEVVRDVRQALAEQALSWLDVDVVLPPGSFKEADGHARESILPEEAEEELVNARYGEYAPLVKLFGEPAFLPTSRLRRAPSKPTGLSRSTAFSRQQKENLRRELCEFIDTEENYVGKVYDLLNSVAEDFRQKARNKSSASTSPSEDALQGLFPPSLDEILATNTGFLEDIRKILESTENEAIQDIEATTGEPYVPTKSDDATHADVTGAVTFARCLLEWFPKFSDCYTEYIQAHAEFGQYLKIFLRETGSSFSKRVQETGEQRLMSMLIEPVQRLPRYNLYIDNIVKQLPARHPALRPLLRARDIISEICSRDSPSSQQSKVVERLQYLIPSWPQNFHPQGRLITAMDVVELAPPYRKDVNARGASPGILLLFADELVLLIKSANKTMSARGLLAEIDNPSVPLDETPQIATQLIFLQRMKLSNVWFTEVDDGSMLQLYHSDGSTQPPKTLHSLNASSLCMFYLAGSYEGKASKWLEETVKARVESRFSEAERDSNKWEARSLSGELNLFSAVFEEGEGPVVDGRKEAARVRVVVEPSQGSRVLKAGEEGVEVVASVTANADGIYLLEMEGMNDFATRDRVTVAELLPVLTKRVSNYLQMRNQIRNPALTSIFLLCNQQILQSLKIRTEGVEEDVVRDRTGSVSGRGSPVKMLSNLFGGSVREYGTPRKHHRSNPSLGDIPRFAPMGPQGSPYKSSSRPTSRDDAATSKSSLGLPDYTNDPLVKLEEALATYVLSLHARKGNVVGRVIRNRANADELAVNELYNALLEEPSNLELAAQQPVDVLFRSFEKFVHVAWREKMGLVVPVEILTSLQSHPETYPGDFEEHFRKTITDIPPQNQRALRAMIKLLADLLEGTGNDGDRGILTAAFAEVLGPDGNAHDIISLLDRFIEDIDSLFGRPSSSGSATPSQGSMNSRYGSKNVGSISSSTSSLKKRFGFASLNRENSKSDFESKVGQVWRTLSKTGRNPDGQSSSLSKATPLMRSQSTDQDTRVSPKRPGSRDRPTVLGAFAFEDSSSRTLATIGEGHEVPRKKRRSSLSDLRELQAIQNADPSWSPKTPRRVNEPATNSTPSSSTPSPPKPSGIPSPTRFSTPSRKECSPAPTNSAIPRPRNGHGNDTSKLESSTPTAEDITILTKKFRSKTISENIPPTPLHRIRGDSSSSIPTLHRTTNSVGAISTVPLSERPSSGNRPKTASNALTGAGDLGKPTGLGAPITFSPTKKLRMQSPQKLRERLQKEQNAIQGAEMALQAELSKIGNEIANLPKGTTSSPTTTTSARPTPSRLHTDPLTLGPARPTNPKTASDTAVNTSASAAVAVAAPTATATDTATITTRIAALESRIPTLLSALTERTAAIATDMASSLQVSESRARQLDELCREANAENEALYARFNDELGRVLRAVRAGDGVDEMRRRLREQHDECERLRKENRRLKRENLGLRAQLKEG